MFKWLIKWLKTCDHNWFLEYKIRDYYDCNGNHVELWKCMCTKCGDIEVKKYIRGSGLL